MSWEDNYNLHKELNFLVFWGKYDAHTVKRLPTAKRKWHVQMTLDNLKMLYGSSGEGE